MVLLYEDGKNRAYEVGPGYFVHCVLEPIGKSVNIFRYYSRVGTGVRLDAFLCEVADPLQDWRCPFHGLGCLGC